MQLSNVADEPSILQSEEQSGEEKLSSESSEQEPKTAAKCPMNDAAPSRDGQFVSFTIAKPSDEELQKLRKFIIENYEVKSYCVSNSKNDCANQ